MSKIQVVDLPQEDMLLDLTHEDLQFIQGAVWAAIAVAVGAYVVANWSDIKHGIADGFSGN